MSDPITCASGKTHNQINNWRGATLKWQLLFIDLFLQVEIERCKLQVNEISWVRFFSSNTVNNCCPLMHTLVLLQANFLNINKKPIQMKGSPGSWYRISCHILGLIKETHVSGQKGKEIPYFALVFPLLESQRGQNWLNCNWLNVLACDTCG